MRRKVGSAAAEWVARELAAMAAAAKAEDWRKWRRVSMGIQKDKGRSTKDEEVWLKFEVFSLQLA
jgi:hypothetical protein